MRHLKEITTSLTKYVTLTTAFLTLVHALTSSVFWFTGYQQCLRE